MRLLRVKLSNDDVDDDLTTRHLATALSGRGLRLRIKSWRFKRQRAMKWLKIAEISHYVIFQSLRPLVKAFVNPRNPKIKTVKET